MSRECEGKRRRFLVNILDKRASFEVIYFFVCLFDKEDMEDSFESIFKG